MALLQDVKYFSLASAEGENTEVARGGARENEGHSSQRACFPRSGKLNLPLNFRKDEEALNRCVTPGNSLWR